MESRKCTREVKTTVGQEGRQLRCTTKCRAHSAIHLQGSLGSLGLVVEIAPLTGASPQQHQAAGAGGITPVPAWPVARALQQRSAISRGAAALRLVHAVHLLGKGGRREDLLTKIAGLGLTCGLLLGGGRGAGEQVAGDCGGVREGKRQLLRVLV